MMKKIKTGLALITSLCALAAGGCTQTTDTNANPGNANTAVVTGDNSSVTTPPATTPENNPPPSTVAPGGGGGSVTPGSSGGVIVNNGANTPTPRPPARTAPLTPAPTPQIGSGANDFYLFTQARAALDADGEINKANIVLDVREGAAVLTGTVASDTLVKKAGQLVQGVSGIKSVKNQLRAAGRK